MILRAMRFLVVHFHFYQDFYVYTFTRTKNHH